MLHDLLNMHVVSLSCFMVIGMLHSDDGNSNMHVPVSHTHVNPCYNYSLRHWVGGKGGYGQTRTTTQVQTISKCTLYIQ